MWISYSMLLVVDQNHSLCSFVCYHHTSSFHSTIMFNSPSHPTVPPDNKKQDALSALLWLAGSHGWQRIKVAEMHLLNGLQTSHQGL